MTETQDTKQDAVTTTEIPTKPESWADEIWNDLVEAEQWLVADLHELGYIFTHDIWPAFKAALGLLFSQLGSAALGAILANIADPALIPAAVGSALLLTTTTTGVADGQQALASAKAAMDADPAVKSLLANQAGQNV